jgi:hypothetical protein
MIDHRAPFGAVQGGWGRRKIAARAGNGRHVCGGEASGFALERGRSHAGGVRASWSSCVATDNTCGMSDPPVQTRASCIMYQVSYV